MATPENLIRNPSFELDFEGWQVWRGPDPTLAQIVIDTVDVYSGAKSVKFVLQEGGRGNVNQTISKTRLIEGTPYQFRVAYKTTREFYVYIYQRATDGTVTRYDRILCAPSVDWMVTPWLEFSTPTGEDWLNFGAFQVMPDISGAGEANLDDFEMYPLEAPPPPPTYLLSVDTTPITGVPFKINGVESMEYTTPWSGTLEEGTYQIAVPATVIVDEETYNFVSWEDASTSRVRNVNLTADMTITATYEVGPPPKPCFIATATFDTALAPELKTLRRFRDRCLPNPLVQLYYITSPPMAEYIRRHSNVRRTVRQLLEPLIKTIKRLL